MKRRSKTRTRKKTGNAFTRAIAEIVSATDKPGWSVAETPEGEIVATHKPATSAGAIAQQAAELVSGARASAHGPKLDNHQRIAAAWNGILAAAGKSPSTPLDAHDVANLMEALKIARRYCGAFNVDDYVDGAGYAACAGEIKAAMLDAS